MARNARKKTLARTLDKVSQGKAPDRISALERRIMQLEKDVAMLKGLSGSPFLNEVAIGALKKKRGKKQRILDEKLFSYRDGLVLWLEPVWPWVAERLPSARTPEELTEILEAIAVEPEQRPDYQKRLLSNAEILFKFLRDEKYPKTELPRSTVMDALTWPWEDAKCKRAADKLPTRRIANAMAGVPDIAWPTSRDRCSEVPSEVRIAVNMDLHCRDQYGIPALDQTIFAGMWSPVPKPCQPIVAQPDNRSAQTANRTRISERGNESSATEHVRGR